MHYSKTQSSSFVGNVKIVIERFDNALIRGDFYYNMVINTALRIKQRTCNYFKMSPHEYLIEN